MTGGSTPEGVVRAELDLCRMHLQGARGQRERERLLVEADALREALALERRIEEAERRFQGASTLAERREWWDELSARLRSRTPATVHLLERARGLTA